MRWTSANENKLMFLFPKILSKCAGDELRAAANGLQYGNSGGVVHWAEDVQNFLQTYAMKTKIRDASDYFLNSSK